MKKKYVGYGAAALGTIGLGYLALNGGQPAMLSAQEVQPPAHEDRIRHLESLMDPSINVCGNGVIDYLTFEPEPAILEACDGEALAGQSCASQSFDDGVIGCLPECDGFDLSGCFNNPDPPDPPDPPAGTLASSVWTPIVGSSMRIGGPSYLAAGKTLYDPKIDDQWDDLNAGKESFSAIHRAWSGGTCVGNELVVWGGGHGDGAHNGVFAVNVHSGEWRRVTQPSPVWRPADCPGDTCQTKFGPCAFGNCPVGPDGLPVARHTYDHLTSDGTYLYSVGGATWQRGSNLTPNQWRLNVASGTWEQYPMNENSRVRAVGAMEFVDNKLYHISPAGSAIYDTVAGGAWKVGSAQIGDQTTIAYSPNSDTFYAIGDGRRWSRTRGQWLGNTSTTLPLHAITATKNPGGFYYAPEKRMVFWAGGPKLVTWSEERKAWEEITPAGDPGPQAGNGTYGRMQLCDGRIAVVSGTERNMWYLDLTGTPPPKPLCGNSVVEPPEFCDDGNTANGDGCSATCLAEPPPAPVCGNSTIEAPETCDDGNVLAGDGCSATCIIEPPPPQAVCGNGKVELGEACDDGNQTPADGCSATCEVDPLPPSDPVCGNGKLESGEHCDDGNVLAGDGCNATCEVEAPEPPTGELPDPMLGHPYYATPPGDAILVSQCGGLPNTWEQFTIKTNGDLNTLKYRLGREPQLRIRVLVPHRADPYPPIDVRGGRCVALEGIPGPNGELPLVTAVNAQGSRPHSNAEIKAGGVMVSKLSVSPGIIEKLRPEMDTTVADCFGSPNDRTFWIIRDTESHGCGHHTLITTHAHQLYVELGRVHFSMADSHSAYVDHNAMLYVYDSKFESPGWGHALRCVALRCVINNVKVSNIQFDGTILPPGSNPIHPNRRFVGMHPFEIYTCGNSEVKNIEVVYYHENGTNIDVGAAYRDREAFHTCDVGEVRGTQWSLIPAASPQHMDPARWALTTPFQASVDGYKVTCLNQKCAAWDAEGTYPRWNNYDQDPFRGWINANKPFLSWQDFSDKVTATGKEPWIFLLTRSMFGNRNNLMKGVIGNNQPWPVPLPGWYQRANFKLRNVEMINGSRVMRARPTPNDFCFGTPATATGCTEQYDGQRFRQANIDYQPN